MIRADLGFVLSAVTCTSAVSSPLPYSGALGELQSFSASQDLDSH